MVLAFPPFGLGFLAWFALVPLLLGLEGQSGKKGFLLGLVSGFAFFLGSVYWVVHSMSNYGGVAVWASIGVMLLLVLYLSLYWGAFGFFATLTAGLDNTARLLLLPAFWVALEYLRGNLFTGFPWVLAGYTQADYLPLIQVADTTGSPNYDDMLILVQPGQLSASAKANPSWMERCGMSPAISRARRTRSPGKSTTFSPPRRSDFFSAAVNLRSSSSNSVFGISSS